MQSGDITSLRYFFATIGWRRPYPGRGCNFRARYLLSRQTPGGGSVYARQNAPSPAGKSISDSASSPTSTTSPNTPTAWSTSKTAWWRGWRGRFR